MVRAAEVEILITADDSDVARAEKNVKTVGDRIAKNPVEKKVTGDEKPALASMDRVEKAAQKLVSKETALTVNANITRAEKNTDRIQQRLDYLRSIETTMDVGADITRAERSLQKAQRNLEGLRGARAEMVVDVDDDPARQNLKAVADFAEQSAKQGGTRAGSSFGKSLDGATRGVGEKVGQVVGDGIGSSLENALTAIPVAGGIILAGVAIGKAITGAIEDGLQAEVGVDRLQALTGISPADALRLGRLAGEAYTRNFGESIEANMDTTRLALQFDLIDEKTTTRNAQRVVEGLAGIADVLGEDVRPIATAVTTLLRTGLARSADEAYDILASGAQRGLNRNEDLLDTLTEYPVVLTRLGLTGRDMLGLLNQGLEAGARNTDVVADGLKEFQIRATDASEASSAGFESIGLNAEEMTAKIARGGQDARDGLQLVLDKLRETEDPVVRNAAAVALFGTKAEDLGEALFALDLDTAAAKFDNLEGSARRMFETLSDNDASRIQSAQRNIEVASDGIEAALAQAFSEPLGDLADFVSQNRGPVMQFLLDLANGAIDFGVSMVEASADGTEAIGDLVAGPLAEAIDTAGKLMGVLGNKKAEEELTGLAEQMRDFDDAADDAAEKIRTKLIDQGLEPARAKLNEFGEGAVALGYLNDASLRLADSLGRVGYDANGARIALDQVDTAHLRSTDSGKLLESQIRGAIAALADEVDAATRAGESQEELAGRYQTGTQALADQLVQMGLSREQAQELIDTILATPSDKVTTFGSNAVEEQGRVQALADRVTTLPDGRVYIRADTDDAYARIMNLQAALRQVTGDKSLRIGTGQGGSGGLTFADGAIVEFMAAGGLRGLTPMPRIAQVVPPSTWRVVGDRTDVPELYTPLDGSPRSWALLMEGLRRMPGVQPMADGGVTGPAVVERGASVSMVNNITAPPSEDPRVFARVLGREFADQIAGR